MLHWKMGSNKWNAVIHLGPRSAWGMPEASLSSAIETVRVRAGDLRPSASVRQKCTLGLACPMHPFHTGGNYCLTWDQTALLPHRLETLPPHLHLHGLILAALIPPHAHYGGECTAHTAEVM